MRCRVSLNVSMNPGRESSFDGPVPLDAAPVSDDDAIARARMAAEQAFKLEDTDFEPTNTREASAAVQRLGELFGELSPLATRVINAARSSGGLVSDDGLQGLAEIVQNADDVQASEVRFAQTSTALLVSHNGTPVQLADVLALATPWLTTKADDAESIGRFGVGLSTLRALATTFEVHCAPYYVRIGDPTVAPVDPPDLPPRFDEPGWTTLRISPDNRELHSADLEEWFTHWNDSALLFLRHVVCATLMDPGGDPISELTLSRRREKDVAGSEAAALSRELVTARDGRSWAVYCRDFRAPTGVPRADKAVGSSTPVAVALPLGRAGTDFDGETTEPATADVHPIGGTKSGRIYAGLPVAQMRSPLLANAQFDPLISRRGLAPTPWNSELVELVAKLWLEAMLDLFERQAHAAWQAVPLPCGDEGDTASGVIGNLEAAVLSKARQDLASRLSFSVPEQGRISLSELAVEAQPLEGILQDAEIAQLAGLAATLPINVRDPAGRWRSVLDDWRSNGSELPEAVNVERALDLVRDESRPVGSSIALVAAGLRENLGALLLKLPCVITNDEQRLLPPAESSATAVSAQTGPLAEQLDIVTTLHPEHHASTNDASEVLEWLQEYGSLVDGSDDSEVLRRLAKAGRSEQSVSSPLTDEQVRALRDAFESLAKKDQETLGPDIGRAVRLKSYTYSAEGHKRPSTARPVDAYLPRMIDREPDSFAVAAGKSQGLMWLSDHYASSLRSRAGREGMGAQRFLRLLGAETAPLLQPHPQQVPGYQKRDRRPGLPRVDGEPEARSTKMIELDTTHTLEDHCSPALLTVITDISRESQGKRRRQRANALLAALGRAWDRRLSQCVDVDAAEGYHRWVVKGRIPAFWLLQARSNAWLDDRSGTAREPAELRRRTPGTEALYGATSPDYLHFDFDQQNRPGLLTALGVSGDPSRSELVERFQKLRSASDEDEISPEDLRRDAALVYQALARSLSGGSAGSDLTESQLRQEFARHDLVLTNLGWRPPGSVFKGPPIFRDLRAFAPPLSDCEQLWRALQLKEPSPSDCLETLRAVARRRKHAPDPTEEAILLETLRALAEHHSAGRTIERPKLARLALWTSIGWMRERPVLATDDPVLAAGLGDRLPIWQPGGELRLLRPLLKPMRVTEIQAKDAEVISPELALRHDALTEYFHEATELMRDALQRNDPKLAERLTVSWDELATYTVKVHSSLSLAVTASGQEYECKVDAKADAAHATFFVRERSALSHRNGGGRALAALFEGEGRRVVHEWRAACDEADEGTQVRPIELASEIAAREESESDVRLAEFGAEIATKHRSRRLAADRVGGNTQNANAIAGPRERPRQSLPVTVVTPRRLVDPDILVLDDPNGHNVRRSPDTASRTNRSALRGSSSLNEPRNDLSGPGNKTPVPGYSGLDRETVGLELVRKVLGSDENQIADLRNQRGVGADAVDEMKRFYELKVFAGSEPDEVTLTSSEVQRASSISDFFLAIVSNVEESAEARPTVRIINDPLSRLRPIDKGSISLAGLREATSVLYEFVRNDDPHPTNDGG